MDETQQIGEILQAIYDEKEFNELFTEIKEKMSKNEKLSEKNKKILEAIRAQVEDITLCHKQMMDYAKKREDFRIYYDHYRGKVEDLKKAEMKKQNEPVTSGSFVAKDNSKLVRNQGKFENAMHNYETAQKTLDTLCSDILDKADQIQVNLNIKFTKNTQLAHYAQMEQVYADMEDLEQRMNDVHL